MAVNHLRLARKTIPRWLSNNSVVIALVFVVFIFSFLLPDISQKLHKHSELKAIKNTIYQMQTEVKRAEVACLAANEEMCTLHRTLCEEGTKTVTVHNMGYAYDDLQRDLIELARVNSKESKPTPPTRGPIPCRKRRALDEKALENLNLLYAKVTKDNDNACKVLIANKGTGSALALNNVALAKNATTLTRFPLKATAVGSEPVALFQERTDENECIHKCRAKNNVHVCYKDCESARRFQKF